MNELAVQGANDTNEDIDRDAINEELDALTTELDRISTTTQFNKQNLLDGSFNSKNLQVGANANQKIAISIDNMNAQSLGLRSVQKTLGGEQQTGTAPTKLTYLGTSYAYDATSTKEYNVSEAQKAFSVAVAGLYLSGNYAQQFDAETGSAYYVAMNTKITTHFATADSAASADVNKGVSEMRTNISDSFKDYITTSGTEGTALSTYEITTHVSVENYDTANNSITAIQEAINRVSSQRSALGAIQNRLEHTVANLDNVSENTQSAESRIRDTDMADEMVQYSKNNILAQAGQAMLAQSNQSTQGVLSLLQ
jgi:flagellin